MTLLHRAIIALSFAGVLGSAVYELKQQNAFDRRLQAAREQENEWRAELDRLQQEEQNALEELKLLGAPPEELRQEAAEIHRLRAELTGLKNQSRSQSGDHETSRTEARLKALVTRIEALKDLPERFPQFAIPELRMLTDDDWMILAKSPLAETMANDLTARMMFRQVRIHAKLSFGSKLHGALRRYLKSNRGLFPAHTLALKPYLDGPVDNSLLQRYEFLHSSIAQLAENPAAIILAEKYPVDPAYDTRLVFIGTNQVRIHDIIVATAAADPRTGNSSVTEHSRTKD